MKYLLIIIGLCLSFRLCATPPDTLQKKPEPRFCIYPSIANFSIVGITPFDGYFLTDYVANQLGVGAEHKLSEHMWLYVAYNEWNLNRFFQRFDYGPEDPYGSFEYAREYVRASWDRNKPGALQYRYGYQMIDAAANYRCNFRSRHRFVGGLGLGYTWGTNYTLLRRVFFPSMNSYQYYREVSRGHYLGIILPLPYDFLVWKQRLGIGVQGNARKYFGLASLQVDYGFHVSANF